MLLKVAFFQRLRFVFPNLKKKYIFQKTILSLKFKFSANKTTVIGGKFKFQAQDSFLEYFFSEIWRSEKQIALSEKKPSLEPVHSILE